MALKDTQPMRMTCEAPSSPSGEDEVKGVFMPTIVSCSGYLVRPCSSLSPIPPRHCPPYAVK